MAIEVRLADDADGAAIGACHAEAWLEGYRHLFDGGFLAEAAEQRRHWWRGDAVASADGSILVAVVEGEVVGFVHVDASDDESGRGELKALYVRPSAWGTGAAQALVDEGTATLARAGFTEVMLWTAEHSPRGRRFYAKAGFEATGHEQDRDFGDGRPTVLVELHRTIAATGNS